MMEVAIIGAGIAGCASYIQLKKHLPGNPSIKIFEAYDTSKNATPEHLKQGPTHSSTLLVGGGIAIAPNGLRVLQRLDEDLLREATRSGYATSHSNMKDKNGNLLICIEPSGPDRSADSGPAATMHSVACSRHALWKILRSRVPDEDIITKRVLDITANEEGRNVVRFVDCDDSIEADLIIGADGVHSTARKALFLESKEDPYPPNYEGLVGVGGFVPATDVQDWVEKGSINLIFGGNGFFGYFFSNSDPSDPHRESSFHVSEPGDSLAWWSTYEIKECPDRKTLDLADVARQLRQRHSSWKDPVVQRVIQSVQVESMYPTWTAPLLPTWERNGVVLLGDAAHALSPTSGQGASQALEDSEAFTLFLSHHLGKVVEESGADTAAGQAALKQAINSAARQYTTLRQPRVKEILEAAQRMQGSKRNMGFIKEYAMYFVMRIMGLFPHMISKPMRKVIEYNIAEEVTRMLAVK